MICDLVIFNRKQHEFLVLRAIHNWPNPWGLLGCQGSCAWAQCWQSLGSYAKQNGMRQLRNSILGKWCLNYNIELYIELYSYIYIHICIYIYPQYLFHWTCWRYLTTNRWWFCCFTSWATKTRSISPCLTLPSCAMRKNGASKTSPQSRLECPLDHSRWFMAWLVRHSVLYNHISPISLWRLTIVFLLGSSSLIKPYITY